MKQVKPSPMVIGSVFEGISKLLVSKGVDAKLFYQEFNLTPSIEHNPQQLIPFEKLVNILTKISTITLIRHPAIFLAKAQTQHKVIPYLELLLHAPSVEVALQIALHFRNVYSEVTYWDCSITNGFAILQRFSFAPLQVNDREHCLYTVAMFFLMLKSLLNGSDKIESIYLIQSKEKNNQELEKFFNCPIRYNQDFDGIIITEEYLYKPKKGFDPEKYNWLLKKITYQKVVFPQNQQFSSIVKSLISQTLCTGLCSLNDIANHLGIHPKALQKMLSQEELTFKLVLADVRMNLAKRLLAQKDVSLIQISTMLGYSEPSAFSRAFRAMNNCSPRTWRNLHAKR